VSIPLFESPSIQALDFKSTPKSESTKFPALKAEITSLPVIEGISPIGSATPSIEDVEDPPKSAHPKPLNSHPTNEGFYEPPASEDLLSVKDFDSLASTSCVNAISQPVNVSYNLPILKRNASSEASPSTPDEAGLAHHILAPHRLGLLRSSWYTPWEMEPEM
jgi:hypothetical protein